MDEDNINSLTIERKYSINNLEFIRFKINNSNFKLKNVFIRNNIGLNISTVSVRNVYFLDVESNNQNDLENLILSIEKKVLELFDNNDYELLKNSESLKDLSTDEIKTKFESSLFKNSFSNFCRCIVSHEDQQFELIIKNSDGQILTVEDFSPPKICNVNIKLNGLYINPYSIGISWKINEIEILDNDPTMID